MRQKGRRNTKKTAEMPEVIKEPQRSTCSMELWGKKIKEKELLGIMNKRNGPVQDTVVSCFIAMAS